MYKLTMWEEGGEEIEKEREVPEVLVARFLEAAAENRAAILVYVTEDSDVIPGVSTCPACDQTLPPDDE